MLCVIWAGPRMWWRARARVIVEKATLRQPVGTPEGVFSHSGGRAGVPNWEITCARSSGVAEAAERPIKARVESKGLIYLIPGHPSFL